MTDKGNPKMSVIIVTPDCYETIRKTMKCLHAQTVRDQLEIIIVAPTATGLFEGQTELAGFNNVRVVEIGSVNSTPGARVVGVRDAAAPLVAFAEDHSYPEPHWAEALMAAHRGPWAAVGPAMGNANPHSTLSWANLAIEYGPWLDPARCGPMDHLPGHNSSYKRDLLLAYGSQLEAMLQAESVLHWDLRAQGHQLYLEPTARTFHLNYSRLRSALRLRFLAGRMFAASRARPWSALRRLLYGLAGPLIPLIRMRRVLRDLRRAGRLRQLLPRILPEVAIALAMDAAGEMAGYLFSSGQTMRTLSEMEFHRHRFMNRRDKRALAAEQDQAAPEVLE
jgi:hypothetical protein